MPGPLDPWLVLAVYMQQSTCTCSRQRIPPLASCRTRCCCCRTHCRCCCCCFPHRQVIRELLGTEGEGHQQRYVIVVEHDLSVLDYLSDFICCLYGKPGAYGVVTLPFSVREGINIFLAGGVLCVCKGRGRAERQAGGRSTGAACATGIECWLQWARFGGARVVLSWPVERARFVMSKAADMPSLAAASMGPCRQPHTSYQAAHRASLGTALLARCRRLSRGALPALLALAPRRLCAD